LPLLFFPHPSTPHLSTLSLHDALPIFPLIAAPNGECAEWKGSLAPRDLLPRGARSSLPRKGDEMTCTRPPNNTQATNHYGASSGDRKSTRLNSSHVSISYAVFCLKIKT